MKLRNVLNSRSIQWVDRTEKPSFSLLDLTIYRTWTGMIAQAENKQYNRHLQKPLDVKVVNK